MMTPVHGRGFRDRGTNARNFVAGVLDLVGAGSVVSNCFASAQSLSQPYAHERRPSLLRVLLSIATKASGSKSSGVATCLNNEKDLPIGSRITATAGEIFEPCMTANRDGTTWTVNRVRDSSPNHDHYIVTTWSSLLPEKQRLRLRSQNRNHL